MVLNMLGCLVHHFLAILAPKLAIICQILVGMLTIFNPCSFSVLKFCEILCIKTKEMVLMKHLMSLSVLIGITHNALMSIRIFSFSRKDTYI